MKKILHCSSDSSGCCFYRSYLPYKYLKKDFITDISIGFSPSLTSKYLESDVIILQRHAHPEISKFIDISHNLGKKVLFDIDDLLWNIPKSNVAYKSWTKVMLNNMNSIISKCDAVITSTEPLSKYIKSRYNDKVYVIRNLVEDNFINKVKNDKIKIMFSGSITHSGDFDSGVIHALKHILSKYDIELFFVGYIPDEFNETKYSDKVRFVKGVDINKYIPTLQSINPDIAIAPLVDNYFNICKSNLKFLENTIAGAVSICSDIYPYSTSIIDGETGFLCKTSKEWIRAFENYINNPNLVEMVYKNSVSTIKDKYTWNNKNIDEVCCTYKDIIDSI